MQLAPSTSLCDGHVSLLCRHGVHSGSALQVQYNIHAMLDTHNEVACCDVRIKEVCGAGQPAAQLCDA